jgi:hypothetical protein
MSEGVREEVESLRALDLEGLRSRWRERYGIPPALRSVELLRHLLAWRIQAEAIGGLDAKTRRLLKTRAPVRREGRSLGVGARITRQWQGRTIEVVVEQEGFRWDGKRYASLSAIATEIAGTRWNGPRFFGLRNPA